MFYSSACGYAIRAMTWLAMKRPDGYMLLEEICQGANVPRYFLAKVFQDLVRRGLLVSAKGRGGGFALARPADEITLLEVVEAVDGSTTLQQCVVGMARCDDKQPCPEHDQWKPIRTRIRKYLERTTLKRMVYGLERKLELVGQKAMTEVSETKRSRKKAPSARDKQSRRTTRRR